jgi:hypothetical protein
VKKIFILFLISLCFPASGWAYTTNTSLSCGGVTITGTTFVTDGSQSDVQAAVNNLVHTSGVGATGNKTDGTFDGDCVYIPSGTTEAWASCVSVQDKNVLITGASMASTIIPNGCFGVTSNTTSSYPGNTSQWRIANMTLNGTAPAGLPLMVYDSAGPNVHYGWRVDHVNFDYQTVWPGHAIFVYGISWGLIDHVTISKGAGAAECAMIFGTRTGDANYEDGAIDRLKGKTHMAIPFQPGSNQAIYIEDSTFNAPDGWCVFDTDYTGTRLVFRHNVLHNVAWYSHWTSGTNVNVQWFEIYNNLFTTVDGTVYPGNAARFQGGGTGIIYNNTTDGLASNGFAIGEDRVNRGDGPLYQCDGTATHYWDGNDGASPDASAPGWPCLAQVGRNAGGITLDSSGHPSPGPASSFPLYLWNNGPQCSCFGGTYPVAGSSCTSGACGNTFAPSSYDPTYTLGRICSGTNCAAGTGSPHSTSGFGNGDFDYCIATGQPSGCGTHTLSYTPLAYPHPLRGDTSGRGATFTCGTGPVLRSGTGPTFTIGVGAGTQGP